MDMLGLLFAVALGGLSICVVVMAFSFLATIIVTRGSDISDTEKIIGDNEDFNDAKVMVEDEDVYYIINTTESVKCFDTF
jgi:hypothetical protein